MTENEVRKYLSRPRDIINGIATKEEQIQRLRAIAEKITPSLSLGKTSGGSEGSRAESCILEIVTLCDEIEAEKKELVSQYSEIKKTIASLENERQRNILTEFYLNQLYIYQIAAKFNLSERSVKLALSEGRKELRKVCTPLHLDK